jgi:hypothetical protein
LTPQASRTPQTPAGQAQGSAYFGRRFAAPKGRERPETMANKAPTPQPGILDISPYVPGESNIPGG